MAWPGEHPKKLYIKRWRVVDGDISEPLGMHVMLAFCALSYIDLGIDNRLYFPSHKDQ